ncbi:MAG: hypothetical protein AAF999_18020 [Pseudomonadota bacterium]
MASVEELLPENLLQQEISGNVVAGVDVVSIGDVNRKVDCAIPVDDAVEPCFNAIIFHPERSRAKGHADRSGLNAMEGEALISGRKRVSVNGRKVDDVATRCPDPINTFDDIGCSLRRMDNI